MNWPKWMSKWGKSRRYRSEEPEDLRTDQASRQAFTSHFCQTDFVSYLCSSPLLTPWGRGAAQRSSSTPILTNVEGKFPPSVVLEELKKKKCCPFPHACYVWRFHGEHIKNAMGEETEFLFVLQGITNPALLSIQPDYTLFNRWNKQCKSLKVSDLPCNWVS